MAYGGMGATYTARQTAVFVDRILRGARPADLPVEQPGKFDLSSASSPRRRSVYLARGDDQQGKDRTVRHGPSRRPTPQLTSGSEPSVSARRAVEGFIRAERARGAAATRAVGAPPERLRRCATAAGQTRAAQRAGSPQHEPGPLAEFPSLQALLRRERPEAVALTDVERRQAAHGALESLGQVGVVEGLADLRVESSAQDARAVGRTGVGLQPRQSATSAGPAVGHPELVAHEPPATALQDRRTPHPACPVLHPAACRKSLDAPPVSADPRVHRATAVASDVIESPTREQRR
jgi:hypothetical protein